MIGQTLDHYRIEAKLGAGGMGVVYKARDTHLDRFVAIKVLPPERVADPERKRRFVQEAKAASALNHPNIVTIYDISSDKGVDFIAMEYVAGKTLGQLIPRNGMPLAEALKCAVEMADALAAAHSAGIIHRDLKPGNVMVTETGLVKLLDFGLAKLTEPAPTGEAEGAETETAGEPSQTKTGTILGTAAYMSPEQVEGKKLDARSDVFSFGGVLYEMLTGRRAFRGDSQISTMSAILRDTPPPLKAVRPDIPAELNRILFRCLEKDREARYSSGAELHKDLAACQSQLAAQRVGVRAFLRKPQFAIPALVLVTLLLAIIGWYSWRTSRVRWARTVALPEIARLLDQQRTCAALRLVRHAERYLPNDPELERIRQNSTRRASFQTDPSGADIYIRDYVDAGDDVPWEHLGRSPLAAIVIPTRLLRYRITKRGFDTAEGSFSGGITGGPPGVLQFKLNPEGTAPSGMVRVPAQKPIEEFWLDKYEVTNRQFKEFVTAGGYEKRERWKYPFVRGGRSIAWEEAMAAFKDATGRPGPATWEFGAFSAGRDDYPVSGVSWYEAAAYCEFAGKTLPTVHHWRRAAGIGLQATILQLSNFTGQGPARVGSYPGLGPYGTYDTAGNLKEWCWNASGENRYISGGAWSEPKYMFYMADARMPFDRSPTNGFRCAKYPNPPSKQLTEPIEVLRLLESQDAYFQFRDRRGDQPAGEAAFQVYKAIHAYDRAELKASIEAVDDTSPYWRKEKISFLAAYGNERVTGYLFLPKNAEPPFQAVISFPGIYAFDIRSSARLETQWFDFIIRSGRAVMHPIYKGMYERTLGGSISTYRAQPNFFRELAIQWYKDLGRSIDYLETRPDIDREKLAYHGLSFGAAEGPRMMALEPRLKVGVLFWGGAWGRGTPAEVDAFHFAPHSRAPTLMVNGRYDFTFPLESSQLPLFRLLGTPQKDKRHFVIEAGHPALDQEAVREALAWLDRYLGPVKTR
jgi:formylglycine-generating enzyme required for sulfatase activity/dienelactone hydrolase/predicted Ser/Thr protein kinase